MVFICSIFYFLLCLKNFSVASSNQPYDVSPKIVNGTDANIKDFPWFVSIQSEEYPNQLAHHCGGSILSTDWVLTAGHCFMHYKFYIKFGSHFLFDKWNDTMFIGVEKWHNHPNFSKPHLGPPSKNDIALLELQRPIPFSDVAQPVKLPPRHYEVSGSYEVKAKVTGFGINGTYETIMPRLQEVELSIVSNEDCDQVYHSSFKTQILCSNICAGVPEGWKAECNGDSGGPLTLENGYQVGIVSWGQKPCGVPPFPGVYTKVSHYIDWIEEVTGLNSLEKKNNYLLPNIR